MRRSNLTSVEVKKLKLQESCISLFTIDLWLNSAIHLGSWSVIAPVETSSRSHFRRARPGGVTTGRLPPLPEQPSYSALRRACPGGSNDSLQ